MTDTDMSTVPNGKEDSRPKCGVCEQVAPRYRCPRCMIRTCSLPCVKRHKADDDCNGVRDKTAYVKTKEFTDINLLNDYRFLEDVGRKTDSATRDPVNSKRKDVPWHLRTLVAQVKKRKTTLHLLPRVFTKRQKNRTKYYHVTDKILWTVEWVFPQVDAKHFDKHVDTDKVGDSLSKIFNPEDTDPAVCHKLRGYLKYGLDNLMLLLKKENCPANDQRFYKLDPTKKIQSSLRNKVIVEYPTIHVIFREKAEEYKLVSDEEESSSSSESEEEDSQVKLTNNNNGEVEKKEGSDDLVKDATSDKKSSNDKDAKGDSGKQLVSASETNPDIVSPSNSEDVTMEERESVNVAPSGSVSCDNDQLSKDNGSSVSDSIDNTDVPMVATDGVSDKAEHNECDKEVKPKDTDSTRTETST